jgi:hypothetical protein
MARICLRDDVHSILAPDDRGAATRHDDEVTIACEKGNNKWLMPRL